MFERFDPMDSTSYCEVMNQPDVALVIRGEGNAPAAAASSPSQKSGTKKESNSRPPKIPEITRCSPSPTSSPQRTPRSPHSNSNSLHRCPSNSGPAFTKAKSRFVEPPPPTSPSCTDLQINHDLIHLSSPPLDTLTPRSPWAGAKEEVINVKKDVNQSWRCCPILAWIELSILILAVGCFAASLTIHKLHNFVLWDMEIWKWCLLMAGFFCGRLVSHWYTKSLVFVIEGYFILKKKKNLRKNVLYYIYGLKKKVQLFIWLALCLLPLLIVFDRKTHRNRSLKTARVLGHVYRCLASLLIATMIWLLKALLVMFLESSFHMKRFFDRIQESLYQYVLTLLGPRAGKGNVKGKGGEKWGVIDTEKLYKMSHEEVYAWMMKGLINAVTMGLTTDLIDQSLDEQISDQGKITTEWKATFVASQIFKNVAGPDSKYIEADHLLEFMPKEQVDIVLQLFEDAGNTGKIEESAVKNWVGLLCILAYFDRKSLSHSLNDTKTAVNQMHMLANIFVSIVIIVLSLFVTGIATIRILLFLSSPVLLGAVVFGNTCKTVFEAIIFLFIMHPFDVGDRCVIDGTQMIVEEMNILTTVFMGDDNQKIYYPNSILATKPITNFYRSPDMGDSVLFSVDVDTSMKCIGVLKDDIKKYIDSKPGHWRPPHRVMMKDMEYNKMNMELYVNHTMNYQNMEEKNSRRSDLVVELKKIFEGLSIKYKLAKLVR